MKEGHNLNGTGEQRHYWETRNISQFISYRLFYCIVTRWSDKHCLSHGICLYQVMMTLDFSNDIANDAELTLSLIITSLSLV